MTPAAEAALSVATRFCSPALLNHSIRSYLWGAMYGTAHGIAFDDELYYVAALLHDLGLTEAFDSHRLPFEEAVLHMRDEVAPADDPESHLLQVATTWEVAGRRPEEFQPDAKAEMLARYPRLGFGAEFLACFEDQARRKPGSAAAASVDNDVAARIAANPLEGHSPA